MLRARRLLYFIILMIEMILCTRKYDLHRHVFKVGQQLDALNNTLASDLA